MKMILFTLLTLILSPVFAGEDSIEFRCTAKSFEACEKRVIRTLTRVGCEPLKTSCQYYSEINDEGAKIGDVIYCAADTNKCHEPTINLVGSPNCQPNTQKINLRKFDNSLTLSYMTGLLQLWVRTICLNTPPI